MASRPRTAASGGSAQPVRALQSFDELAKASKRGAAISGIGMICALGAIGYSVFHLESLDEEVTKKKLEVKASTAEVEELKLLKSELETKTKKLKQGLETKEQFIQGKSSSVAIGPEAQKLDAIKPIVKHFREGWTFRFTFALKVPEKLRGDIERVNYEVPDAAGNLVKLEGAGEDFASEMKFAECTGKATAKLRTRDGQESELVFDWCTLAHWSSAWRYDPSPLHQLDDLAQNCRKTKAVLAIVPEAHFAAINGWRVAQQILHAHPGFLPARDEEPTLSLRQYKVRQSSNVALVAECTLPETCIDFAAAYHAISAGPGTRAPELFCGTVPTFEEESVPAKGVEDPRVSTPPKKGDPIASCYRLAACEGASRGKVEQFRGEKCVLAPSKYPTGCALKASCAEVIHCAQSEALKL